MSRPLPLSARLREAMSRTPRDRDQPVDDLHGLDVLLVRRYDRDDANSAAMNAIRPKREPATEAGAREP